MNQEEIRMNKGLLKEISKMKKSQAVSQGSPKAAVPTNEYSPN